MSSIRPGISRWLWTVQPPSVWVVSEYPGVPATHTVPTLFPDQFVPGCELIPGLTATV